MGGGGVVDFNFDLPIGLKNKSLQNDILYNMFFINNNLGHLKNLIAFLMEMEMSLNFEL